MMDEVIRSNIVYQEHEQKMYHERTQPTEDLILKRNAELRKNPDALMDLGQKGGDPWGRQVASIPFIVYEKAIRDGYELNQGDAEHRSKEMFRFLQSEEGKKCLVREGAI